MKLFPLIMIMLNIACWTFAGICIMQNRHYQYMERITIGRDINTTALCISQYKSHQDIYFIPIDVFNKHQKEWNKTGIYPKEYYMGYYSFSLFYWGQNSPR